MRQVNSRLRQKDFEKNNFRPKKQLSNVHLCSTVWFSNSNAEKSVIFYITQWVIYYRPKMVPEINGGYLLSFLWFRWKFSFVCGAKDQTQVFTHTKHVLYHWAVLPTLEILKTPALWTMCFAWIMRKQLQKVYPHPSPLALVGGNYLILVLHDEGIVPSAGGRHHTHAKG